MIDQSIMDRAKLKGRKAVKKSFPETQSQLSVWWAARTSNLDCELSNKTYVRPRGETGRKDIENTGKA